MQEETPSEQPAAPTPQASSGGKEKNTGMATLAHALGIFTGFVGAMIIYLVEKDEGYVKDQAKEALNFQITIAICYVISWVLIFVLIGGLLVWIVYLANLILCIVAAIAASKGQDYRYPFALRLIK